MGVVKILQLRCGKSTFYTLTRSVARKGLRECVCDASVRVRQRVERLTENTNLLGRCACKPLFLYTVPVEVQKWIVTARRRNKEPSCLQIFFHELHFSSIHGCWQISINLSWSKLLSLSISCHVFSPKTQSSPPFILLSSSHNGTHTLSYITLLISLPLTHWHIQYWARGQNSWYNGRTLSTYSEPNFLCLHFRSV